MEIENPENAGVFLKKTQETFEKDEVRGNLIYGLANNLIINKNYYGNEDPFYSIIHNKEKNAKIIGLMTLPHKMSIFQDGSYNDILMDIFINNVLEHYKSIPGINGEKKITEKFVEKWSKINKCNITLEMNLRCYKLEKVNKYYKPAGIFRKAEISDKNVLKEYIKKFCEDIGQPDNDDERLENNINENINNGSYYVWENGIIVSMAKRTRPSKNGMAINSVYTPKEYRRKGYATAIVAELSKNILNSGKKFCTLFTDLANPISNGIYKKIGYKIVCDNISYKFI